MFYRITHLINHPPSVSYNANIGSTFCTTNDDTLITLFADFTWIFNDTLPCLG